MTKYPPQDIKIYFVPEFLSPDDASYFWGWRQGDDVILVLQKDDAELPDISHLGLPPLQVIGILATKGLSSDVNGGNLIFAIEAVQNKHRIKLVSCSPPVRNAHYIAVHKSLIVGQSFLRHKNVSSVDNNKETLKYELLNAIPFLRTCYLQSPLPIANPDLCHCARKLRMNIEMQSASQSEAYGLFSRLGNLFSTVMVGLAAALKWSQTLKLLRRKALLFQDWFALLDKLHDHRNCLHCAPKYGCCYHPTFQKIAVVTTLRSITVHLVLDLLLGSLIAILVTWIPNTIDEYILRWADWIFSVIRVDQLYSYVDWLMGSPVGMKMNLFLNRVFGLACLFILDLHLLLSTYLKTWISPQSFVYSIAIIGCASVTFLFAAAIDSFTIATLHIRLISNIFSSIYSAFFSVMIDIWRFLRGYKFNPLRNRIDTLKILLYSYSVDQRRIDESLMEAESSRTIDQGMHENQRQKFENECSKSDQVGHINRPQETCGSEAESIVGAIQNAEGVSITAPAPAHSISPIKYVHRHAHQSKRPAINVHGGPRPRQFEDPALLEEKLQTRNQVDSQRMIIASIVGVILIFILPTLFSWHFVFGVAFNGVLGALAFLYFLEEITKSAPIRLLVQRRKVPEMFPSEVYYELMESCTQQVSLDVSHRQDDEDSVTRNRTHEGGLTATATNVTNLELVHSWFALRIKALPMSYLLFPTLSRAFEKAIEIFPFTAFGSVVQYVATGKLPQKNGNS